MHKNVVEKSFTWRIRFDVLNDQDTGLWFPDKPLTVLSPQVSGSNPSIYNGTKVGGDRINAKSTVYSPTSYFWIGRGPEGYPQKPSKPHIITRLLNSIPNPLIEWPSYLPDLNPIENLWGSIKEKLSKINRKTKQELRDKLIEIKDK